MVTQHAQVVVVGGGAFGTSIAYHLARSGVGDVVLLDRFGLADGTTWHSGGFLGQLRSEVPIMQLIAHSSRVYGELSAEDPALDWHQVGSLRLATTSERLAEFERLSELAGEAGVPATVVAPERVAELAPELEHSDLTGAVWIPTDGYVEPESLPLALGAAAARAGVEIRTGVDVLGLVTDSSGVAGVQTAEGLVRARQVVVAAGFATPDLLASVGVFVPIGVSRQQYLVSGTLPGGALTLPTVREPDRSSYFRPMADRLLLGAIIGAVSVGLPGEVPRQARYLYDPIASGLDSAWQDCRRRVPALRDVDVERIVRGPEGVTADGELIADETAIPGLWVAAGGSGHGIAAAGGVGWYVAGLVGNRLDPSMAGPSVDGRFFSLNRFPERYSSEPAAMLKAMHECELGHYAVVPATVS